MQVDQHWTVKKEIQPALLVVLVAQLVGFIVGAAKLHSMIEDHDRRLTVMEQKGERDTALAQEQRVNIVRLQEVTVALKDAITRLERATPVIR